LRHQPYQPESTARQFQSPATHEYNEAQVYFLVITFSTKFCQENHTISLNTNLEELPPHYFEAQKTTALWKYSFSYA